MEIEDSRVDQKLKQYMILMDSHSYKMAARAPNTEPLHDHIRSKRKRKDEKR